MGHSPYSPALSQINTTFNSVQLVLDDCCRKVKAGDDDFACIFVCTYVCLNPVKYYFSVAFKILLHVTL